MPKVEIDYSNTIIYKITCNDINITDTYVGHTTNFVQRKHAHKGSCINEKSSNHKCKLYETIRQKGGWSNWKMEIINFFNCNDHYEARLKEQEYFVLLNANLNSIEPVPKPKILNAIVVKPIEINNVSTQNNKCENDKNKNPKKHICDICDYDTSNIKDYNKHLLTKKHKRLMVIPKKSSQIPKTHIFSCICNKQYLHMSSLCKHKKNCNYIDCQLDEDINKNVQIETTNSSSIDPTKIIDKDELIKYLMKENIEFKNMLIEQNKMVMKFCENH